MKQQSDLTKGNLWSGILLFSLPLMLSNLLQVLFNMSDIAVVGQFAGSHALGSVGSTAILVTLFTGILIGIGSGITVVVAQCIGTGKKEEISLSVHTCLPVAFFCGLIVMLVAFFFAEPLLRLLGTKEELLDGALLYLRIYAFGFPALAVYNYGNSVFSAGGNTKTPLYILFSAGILNVALNLFFVIVCKMSVAGVAIASITAHYFSAFIILPCLAKTKECYKLCFSKIRFHAGYTKKALALGIPAAMQNSIFAVANLFIQAGVNRLDTVFVEGNAAAANADALVFDVMAAVYTACTSFVGQNFGAKKKRRIRSAYFISLIYSFAAGAILGLLFWLFGRQLLSIFTNDQAVIDAGMQKLQIMSFSFAVSAVMDNTIAASRGIGKTLLPTIFVFLGSCVFRIIWVYTVFAYYMTLPSLYLLYIFSWTITSIAEVIYFAIAYKEKTRDFPESSTEQNI